jgi:amino acid transporter
MVEEWTMDANVGAGHQAVLAAPETQRLRSNVLSLWPVVAMGLAYMSLAPVIYFNAGFMESEAGGPAMPLAFILVTFAILPTGISFAIMNNRRPSAGSAFRWLWESVAPPVGLWTGWLLTAVYVLAAAIYPAYMLVFFNPFLAYFGIPYSFWTGVPAALGLVAVGTYMVKHDIRLSTKTIAVFMTIEAGFLLLLSLYIIVKQGAAGHLTLKPFTPSAATSFDGFLLALVFGFLSIAGVDSAAPVAEEAKTPRSLIPLATILITLGAGAFYTFCSYAVAVSVPPKTVIGYVNAGLFTPLYPIAGSYVDGLKILVPLTAWSASLASYGASIVCASRLLYAMARQGYAPATFARLDPKKQIPWNASIPALAFSAVVPILLGIWLGENGSNAAGWVGGVFVFCVLIAYSLVNLANLVYHQRFARDQFNWLTTALVPVLGIAINLYILYKGFFQAYLSAGFQMGISIVLVAVAWAVVGIFWAAWQWRRRRAVVEAELPSYV